MRKVKIQHNASERWYVWRKGEDDLKSEFLNCIGVFIFIPADIAESMFHNLAYFEHFGTEDVSFTWFFKRMGYELQDVRDVKNVHFRKRFETHYKNDTDLQKDYEKSKW